MHLHTSTLRLINLYWPTNAHVDREQIYGPKRSSALYKESIWRGSYWGFANYDMISQICDTQCKSFPSLTQLTNFAAYQLSLLICKFKKKFVIWGVNKYGKPWNSCNNNYIRIVFARYILTILVWILYIKVKTSMNSSFLKHQMEAGLFHRQVICLSCYEHGYRENEIFYQLQTVGNTSNSSWKIPKTLFLFSFLFLNMRRGHIVVREMNLYYLEMGTSYYFVITGKADNKPAYSIWETIWNSNFLPYTLELRTLLDLSMFLWGKHVERRRWLGSTTGFSFICKRKKAMLITKASCREPR